MRWLAWLDTLNLIEVFNWYLFLAFLVSTGSRIRNYQAILGLVFASPKRWPKLLALVKTHRMILLGWPSLLAAGMALAVLVSNSLASWLVLGQAQVTFEQLRDRWLALATIAIAGGLMLFFDCQAMFNVGHFDRAALEVTLDKAESWLKSWMAPALRLVTFGFVNPRKVVGAEVQRVLVDANWIMIGGMWRTSARICMQFIFGIVLWLTWACALRLAE